jgi:hypothetical protein
MTGFREPAALVRCDLLRDSSKPLGGAEISLIDASDPSLQRIQPWPTSSMAFGGAE